MAITLNLDDFTVGIEIEFTGITRREAAAAVGEALHGTAHFAGGGYCAYHVTDNSGRVWKIMRDASIVPQKKVNGRIVSAEDEYKCEFVSPILRYTADMPTLQEIVRALRKSGGFPHSSCGVHVHVGAEKFNAKSLRNLANIFKSKQDLLYKALNVNSARANYCKKLGDEFVDRLNKHKPESTEKFADDVYEGYGGYSQNQGIHYSSARYFGINYHAYYTKGTIEFRLFNSTLHAGWIRSYTILAISMCNQAVKQNNASSKVTTSTNECYTFRTWLLRMGFIGDIYETPRRLLLERFSSEGHSKAWRYEEPTVPIIHGDADNENN